jgi:UDP-3-O-[3-hydroxymyristoyl] glucosamine N-acyltransferase
MKRKYEFTGETRTISDRTLHQIRAIRNFGNVKAGQLGGWIEKEDNLSHKGKAWIYVNACVFENAKIIEDASASGSSKIFGNAIIRGKARITDKACVFEYALVGDKACVSGDSKVFGHASMLGESHATGNSMVRDKAVLLDKVYISGNTYIDGAVRLSGNTFIHISECDWYRLIDY